MLIVNRKLSIIVVLGAVALLANVGAVADWLQAIGAVHWAQYVCAEYATGTALTVIVVILLLVPATVVCATAVTRCSVCDAALWRQGKYCPECGSRG